MADSTSSGQVVVPATTPTLGALLGAVASSAVAMHVGADPMTQAAATTVTSTVFAWLFHFLHQKFGTPE